MINPIFQLVLCRSLLLLALFVSIASIAAAQTQGRELHESYDLAPNGVVSVNNSSGYIRVSSWSENKVQLDAVKRGPRDEDADQVRIQVNATRERIEVQTIYARGRSSNISVDYDLKVPRTAILNQINSASGDVTITGPVERVVASSRSGNVSASAVNDAATLNSRSGNITTSKIGGELRADTASGEVVASEVGSRLYAQSRGGNVRAADVRDDVTATTNSGNVKLDKIGGRATARAMSGWISIADIGGDVQADTLSDSITVTNARGRVNANAVSGNVTLRNVGEGARAVSVSGSVDLSDVKGRIEAATTSGWIRLTNVDSRDVSAKAVSGDVRFTGKLHEDGHYEFESFSSNVILFLPPDSQFRLSARSHSGSINTEFPLTLGQGTRTAERGFISGTVGKGGAEVRASTFSGNVYIRKNTGQAR
jgi:DUF4097 and DUF4098 domain-containing protein YvlB